MMTVVIGLGAHPHLVTPADRLLIDNIVEARILKILAYQILTPMVVGNII